MSGEYPRGFVELFEDFTKDNVTDLNETSAGTGSQDITNRHGGWWRLTVGTTDTCSAVIAGERSWEVDEGHPLVLEARVKFDDADKASSFIGFGDAVNIICFENEDGTLDSTATDGFGFLLEGEQDLTWQAVAVDTNVDKTMAALTLGADAKDAVIQTLRMEANPNDSGTVKYFIDGVLVATKTSWFDSGIVFCPSFGLDGRASAVNEDIDYIYVQAPRS